MRKEYEQFNRLMNQAGLSFGPSDVIHIDSNQYTGETWKNIAKEQEELSEKSADLQVKKRTYEEEVAELEGLLNDVTEKQLPHDEKIELEQQRDALKADQSAGEWRKQLQEEKKQASKRIECQQANV